MAQYDIFEFPNAQEEPYYGVVLQHDGLYALPTVLVAPLWKRATATPIAVINPVVDIEGEAYFISMEDIAAYPSAAIDKVVGTAELHFDAITAAVDRLFTGI